MGCDESGCAPSRSPSSPPTANRLRRPVPDQPGAALVHPDRNDVLRTAHLRNERNDVVRFENYSADRLHQGINYVTLVERHDGWASALIEAR